MKLTKLAALAALLACGGALAQDAAETVELKVVVAGDGADHATDIHWVGQDLNLDSLQMGESREVTGDSGETITVTRTADGMQFDVGGETVVVPDMGMHGEHVAFVDISGEHDIDINVQSGSAGAISVAGVGTHAISAAPGAGVTIISADPLDDSVRESIRSVLISAGIDEQVRFIDHAGGDGEARVVTRKIEVVR
jgi:hypothetical protein